LSYCSVFRTVREKRPVAQLSKSKTFNFRIRNPSGIGCSFSGISDFVPFISGIFDFVPFILISGIFDFVPFILAHFSCVLLQRQLSDRQTILCGLLLRGGALTVKRELFIGFFWPPVWWSLIKWVVDSLFNRAAIAEFGITRLSHLLGACPSALWEQPRKIVTPWGFYLDDSEQ
jgi:hypothetical protein